MTSLRTIGIHLTHSGYRDSRSWQFVTSVPVRTLRPNQPAPLVGLYQPNLGQLALPGRLPFLFVDGLFLIFLQMLTIPSSGWRESSSAGTLPPSGHVLLIRL